MDVFLDSSTPEKYQEDLAQEKIQNKGYRPGGMLPETRILLQEFYAPFNKKLAALLSDNRFLWKH